MKENETFKLTIDEILIRNKRYLDPNFSASNLAEMLGVPGYKVSRVLKKEYGMSYTDIVYQHRIHEAMKLLKDRRYTPYTVDDIADMVGFKNRQSFFTAFRKVSGTTPDAFRKGEN